LLGSNDHDGEHCFWVRRYLHGFKSIVHHEFRVLRWSPGLMGLKIIVVP
jgi:hypothetical protein